MKFERLFLVFGRKKSQQRKGCRLKIGYFIFLFCVVLSVVAFFGKHISATKANQNSDTATKRTVGIKVSSFTVAGEYDSRSITQRFFV